MNPVFSDVGSQGSQGSPRAWAQRFGTGGGFLLFPRIRRQLNGIVN